MKLALIDSLSHTENNNETNLLSAIFWKKKKKVSNLDSWSDFNQNQFRNNTWAYRHQTLNVSLLPYTDHTTIW